MIPKINMDKIHDIVDSTEQMPEIRKDYLKKSLDLRYEQILKLALNRILKLEKESAPRQSTLTVQTRSRYLDSSSQRLILPSSSSPEENPEFGC
ncbi:hypothetical protein FACS1894188_07490 [Clostridia bacterium]|nr:hypothetical protein FACS1894188_07490 [Clostridia bacterium]